MHAIINGWRVDAAYLIGRRFEFVDNAAPDVTFISAKGEGSDEQIRAHALDGGSWWLPMRDVLTAVATGVLVEAAGAPFVNDRAVERPIWYHNVKGWGAK